nr:MAG TPA: hypothetical protein [Caudoviricetes sp.]
MINSRGGGHGVHPKSHHSCRNNPASVIPLGFTAVQ